VLAQIQNEYPQDVRLVYRHFPLISIHDKAALASQASEAAGKQDQFWPMHDLLFERQSEWVELTVEQFQTWLVERAGELGMESDQFATDLVSQDISEFVKGTWDRGVEIGFPGTPFLVVDGQAWPQNLPLTPENLRTIIELKLLEKRQFTACPQMTIDTSRQYIATITTEAGEIVIELFPDKAPIAVNNFVFLAENGWYDGVTFHRVIKDYIAQAGDPSGTGFGGPGYAFVNETTDLKFDGPGLIAMANSGPDTNGSQFFITYTETPQLDGGYTIFGQVISGMEYVEALTPRDPAQNPNQAPGDTILSISIEES
jgi:cyclophilin family peptidyl-prolyl cis-trans isomerase